MFSYCELRIPLGEDFYTIKDENFDAVYSNGEYAVAILRISFVAALREGIPETMSAYEFGEFRLDRCDRPAHLKGNDTVYCEYYDRASGREYFYLEAFYRSADAYFVVLFTTDAELDDEGRAAFLNYSKGVYFTN